MSAVYLCECRHPKVRHQGGTYWCLTPDCACKRYTPDFQAPVESALRCPDCPALFTHPDTLLQHAVKLHATGAPVISAEEGESTSARLRRVEQERDQAREMCFAAEEDLTRLRRERDEALANANRMAKDHIKLLDRNVLAEAELASARAELEQLRNRGGVIAQHVRYLCETCGSRYGIDYTDHAHGPLTPVVVTITRQGGQDG